MRKFFNNKCSCGFQTRDQKKFSDHVRQCLGR